MLETKDREVDERDKARWEEEYEDVRCEGMEQKFHSNIARSQKTMSTSGKSNMLK